jgi:hypothetical protein
LLQISLSRSRRDEDTGRAGDGLDDQRRNGRWVMQQHQPLEVFGKLDAVRRLAAREGVAGEVVRVADVVDAGEQRPELLAVAADTAHRHAAEIDPVIAALAADEARARPLPDGALIGERNLERGFDRFRAGIGEKDVVDALRHVGDEARRELEDPGVPHLEGRRIVEFAHLPLDGLDDLRTGVAGVAAPQARGAVEHLPPVGGGVIHAVRRNHQPRRRLELPVRRERHPISFEIVGVQPVGHRCLPGRSDFALAPSRLALDACPSALEF